MPVLRFLIAVLFIAGGVFHFINTNLYLKIMPPYIPWHLAMVYISGVAEIAGGVGLLVPILRKPAAWGLVALLIAVFPANVFMAMERIQVTAHPIPSSGVFMGSAAAAGRDDLVGPLLRRNRD